MFHIVLVEPEIPPNTGNIIRLAANTGCTLHLVEPLGFSMQDKHMRRAGLDYHEYATIKRHTSWQDFLAQEQPDHLFALTTKAQRFVHDVHFCEGDYLVFGSETKGLSQTVRSSFLQNQCVRLPMVAGQRSLNLSNAVAITVYEAWRQNGFGIASLLTLYLTVKSILASGADKTPQPAELTTPSVYANPRFARDATTLFVCPNPQPD